MGVNGLTTIYMDGVQIGVTDGVPEITAESIIKEEERIVSDFLGEYEEEIEIDPRLAKRLLMIIKKELGIIETVRKNERLEF